MGKRGPKTIPAKIKERRGTVNTTRENQNSQDAQGYRLSIAEPPDYLSGQGREVWNELYPQINNLEILRPQDLHLLAGLCQNLGDFREINQLLNKDHGYDKYLVDGSHGQPMQRPLLKIRKDMLKSALEISNHFGITPSTRASFKLSDIGSGASDPDFPNI